MNYKSALAILTAIPVLVFAGSMPSVLYQPFTQSRQGVGDLLIAPTRVVFEKGKRSAEINLLNTGNKPATYRISLIHQRMSDDGKLNEIDTPAPGETFADSLVRFTPHQVLLEPNVSQIIRIQLRLPASLDSGEYRSHMLFRAVPVADAPTDSVTAPGQPPKGIDIKITPIYGLSIPVIVRHGETTAETTFADAQLTKTPDGAPVLVGKLARAGNISVYGDIIVEFGPSGGKFQQIARANGIAIYTPNTTRNIALILNAPKNAKFENGTLRVTYRTPDVDGGQTIVSTTLVVK
jgi:hypothetical protein